MPHVQLAEKELRMPAVTERICGLQGWLCVIQMQVCSRRMPF